MVVCCDVVPVAVVLPVEEVCVAASDFNLLSNKKSQSYDIPSFRRNTTVQRFVKYLVHAKVFSLGHVKRQMHRYLSKLRGRQQQFVQIEKSDGRLVKDMFDSDLFHCGATKLPPDSYPLQAETMRTLHRDSCDECRLTDGGLSPKCYFTSMIRCVEFGWDPPVDRARIVPKFKAPRERNYSTVTQFDHSTEREFADMLAHGVIVPCAAVVGGVVNPLGSVVKNSDKMRARVLTGVSVVDQASLTQASDLLVSKGHPKIKARVITDVTATGINRAAYSPPFSYPGLADGLQLVERNCVLGKADIGRYFHSFPLALSCRDLFQLFYREQLWHYARCFFGFTACPYYCSTFSAEIKRWLEYRGVDTSHMMDDFLLAGDTLKEAQRKMAILISVLESVGFYMSVDKLEFGQQLVFLGVLVDTVRMSLRFERTQASAMLQQMELYRHQMVNGVDIDHGTIRHVCGKLNWYSEVIQSGRLHTKNWWLYEKFHSALSESKFRQLLADTAWWIELLQQWSEDESSNTEYKIWSASELLADPHSMVIVQSDASGTDGYGYFSGYYSEDESQYTYVSKRWVGRFDQLDSHTAELMALEDYLQSSQLQDVMLVWVSDCEPAVFSLNKGRCDEDKALVVLSNILRMCDAAHVHIVGLWVPREENTLADYLSHYAHHSDRDELRGWLSELGLSAECARAARGPDQAQG